MVVTYISETNEFFLVAYISCMHPFEEIYSIGMFIRYKWLIFKCISTEI